MKRNSRRPNVVVTTGGKGVVGHAGARLLCELADGLGLSDALSLAMAETKKRQRGHDRGEVLVDLAIALADGASSISDLHVLSEQRSLFGEVASVPTAWRSLEAIDDEVLLRIATARARARRAAWGAGMDPGFYVIDIDGTLLNAHSEKEEAAATYKSGFGFYPLLAYLDVTGEALAGVLRAGNAGSSTAKDHIGVLDAALLQLPVDPAEQQIIVRTDSGSTTHELAAACRARRLSFVGGFQMRAALATIVLSVPQNAWQISISSDGQVERESGEVAEITDLVDLTPWPEQTRMIVRREQPHPGAQLHFTDVEGYRYQVFVTDLADEDICYLEALYRGRGRVECAIKDAKDTGLSNLPSHSFAINKAWLTLVLIAQDLLAWMKALCLEGELKKAEPKRLRYALLHTAGLVAYSARKTSLRIAADWPWAEDLVRAFSHLPGWSLVT